MKNFHLRSFAATALVLVCGAAFGQSYSSFNQVTLISGVHVQNSGLAYTLTLDPGAYVIYNSQQLDITDIFGFFALKGGTPALSASGSNQNGWQWNYASNAQGSIAGWENPNKSFDIQPGQSKTFTYTSLDTSNLENWGWHFTFAQDWPLTPGAQTAYIQGPLDPVPEPTTVLGLGVGALALLKRRRR